MSETTAEQRAEIRKKYAVQLALVLIEHPGSATAELIDTYEGELCRMAQAEAQLAEAVGRCCYIDYGDDGCPHDHVTPLASLEKHEGDGDA